MSDPSPHHDDRLDVLGADDPYDEHHAYDEHAGYDEVHHDEEAYEPRRQGGSRRAKKKRRPVGCLLGFLVVMALVVGGLYLGVSWVADRLGGGGDPEDFDGVASVEECATSGEVEITVPEGYLIGQIGRLLADEGVVASSGAFTSAVGAGSVRDGTRTMCEGMSGAQAAELMTNADYIGGGNGITITAGRTAEQTFALLAEATGLPVEDFAAAAEDPAIGLPEGADSVEGYLFPDSYDFGPEPTAVSIVTQMVERWKEVAAEVGLVDDAVPGYTQAELLTVASIIEKEVLLPEERPAVAEVIYDRLADQCVGVPAGLLQMDSTVNFIKGETDTPFTTDEDRAVQSPYNTYVEPGLPPGPISAPGRSAMEGAVNPTSEGYCYFVAAGDGSNSSDFAVTYADHLENVRRAQQQ
ncbi:endolytic transglycosylase MltG [Nocardioides sp. ChNu-153]|uniref:endolytic transglycosylase MltG n=1 Tax=unclassified Nocardioides TaxID=2615069 RepID=UPI0024056842|nr:MULTISPECIES: endolytic transglycosylase MltG [unclassified Nocardioides]MDF9717685.1 endolytic transglycosylase MltG [Nocardioides sp. ChNu-99]MDN7121229.1 endolytic transglycosylase MltG [Nocardioides sp. ChNu-153]